MTPSIYFKPAANCLALLTVANAIIFSPLAEASQIRLSFTTSSGGAGANFSETNFDSLNPIVRLGNSFTPNVIVIRDPRPPNDPGLSASFLATNTGRVEPGFASTRIGGSLVVTTGEGTFFDRQNGRTFVEETLTFTWEDGFDDTATIEPVFHQAVGVVSNSGDFTIDAYTDIEANGQRKEIRYGSSTNNFNSQIPSQVQSVVGPVLSDGNQVELTTQLLTKVSYFNTLPGLSGSGEVHVLASWWVEVPEGVAVSSESGRDYTEVSAVPEPAGVVLAGLAALLVYRRRR